MIPKASVGAPLREWTWLPAGRACLQGGAEQTGQPPRLPIRSVIPLPWALRVKTDSAFRESPSSEKPEAGKTCDLGQLFLSLGSSRLGKMGRIAAAPSRGGSGIPAGDSSGGSGRSVKAGRPRLSPSSGPAALRLSPARSPGPGSCCACVSLFLSGVKMHGDVGVPWLFSSWPFPRFCSPTRGQGDGRHPLHSRDHPPHPPPPHPHDLFQHSLAQSSKPRWLC